MTIEQATFEYSKIIRLNNYGYQTNCLARRNEHLGRMFSAAQRSSLEAMMPSAKCLARAQLAAVLRRAVDQYLRKQARRLTPPHRMASAEKRPLAIRLADTR